MEETQRRNATMSERIVVIAEKVNYTEKINMYSEECKRLIFRYDRKIPDYFSVAGAP